jgi:hypothetical protein
MPLSAKVWLSEIHSQTRSLKNENIPKARRFVVGHMGRRYDTK